MISIIIPVYNAEKYIITCLDSIKQQNVDLEVICVNDGSTDDSEKLIKDYCTKNVFVRYIYQENAGAPAARNKGLSLAKGRYCMFFDSDDILFPNALNIMIKAIESENADIVLADYKEIDENEKEIVVVKQRQFIPNLSNHWYFSLCPPLPGNKLIRKAVLDSTKINFESLKIGQDLNFYLRILTVAKKVKYVEQVVMGYRIIDGSISRQYSLKILDICNAIDNVKNFYGKQGYSKEYNEYVSTTELIAYRSQLEKVKFFTKKSEITEICKVLGKRIKKCQVPVLRFWGTYLKEKAKCCFILNKYYFIMKKRRQKKNGVDL